MASFLAASRSVSRSESSLSEGGGVLAFFLVVVEVLLLFVVLEGETTSLPSSDDSTVVEAFFLGLLCFLGDLFWGDLFWVSTSGLYGFGAALALLPLRVLSSSSVGLSSSCTLFALLPLFSSAFCLFLKCQLRQNINISREVGSCDLEISNESTAC